MEITAEEYEKLFTAEVPDVKICLHELRIQPMGVEIDGENRVGYIARLTGHGADGKPMTVDFVATEDVLQETMTRFIEAGMTAAFVRAMNDAEKTGDAGPALAMLVDLSVMMAGAETETDPKEIEK